MRGGQCNERGQGNEGVKVMRGGQGNKGVKVMRGGQGNEGGSR